MVDLIDWPVDLLRPRDATFHLRTATRTGGRSLIGVEQIIDPGISWWEVTYDFAREFDGARLRTFEVMIGRMRGRRNVAKLPICDPYRYGAARSPAQQPYADGKWHYDGTGFAVGDGTSEVLYTSAAAVAGATSLTVGMTAPVKPPLQAGDYFTVQGFLHRVDTATDAGAVGFYPPLRRDVAANARVQTDPPVAHMRLATDDEGVRARELLRWGGEVRVTFVEAFDR